MPRVLAGVRWIPGVDPVLDWRGRHQVGRTQSLFIANDVWKNKAQVLCKDKNANNLADVGLWIHASIQSCAMRSPLCLNRAVKLHFLSNTSGAHALRRRL